jgi:putative ABC transport system permease protein
LDPTGEGDLTLRVVDDVFPSTVKYLEMALFALATILIGVALVSVFITTLLATQETTHVIATLKALGMTPRQVIAMTVTSAAGLGLAAGLLGTPIGWLFTAGLLNLLTLVYGFGRVAVPISPTLIIVTPLTAAVGIAGSLIPARWAAHAQIVHALRRD